jgi:hypothetical protein
MFIQRVMVHNLVLAVGDGRETLSYAMLWLAAYTFLLRVPSEALPMCRGGDGFNPEGAQSVLWLADENTLCLQLRARKNLLHGDIITRNCHCACGSSNLCPIHGMWHRFFAHLRPGEQPWANLTPCAVRAQLRQTLSKLKVPEAHLYGTHDFRRGHAKVRSTLSVLSVCRLFACCHSGYARVRGNISQDMPRWALEECSNLQVSPRRWSGQGHCLRGRYA